MFYNSERNNFLMSVGLSDIEKSLTNTDKLYLVRDVMKLFHVQR